MKIKSSQLIAHLKRQGVAPLYLLTGDEPLQMMESADILRDFARTQGYTDRVILTVETGFSWDSLGQYADNFSLFASKCFLDIRLGSKSPGNEGTKALLPYCQNPSATTTVLLTTNKLDGSKQKTKWFKALDQAGVVIQVFPLILSELPAWIGQRMSQYGLVASHDVINMIAERSEGHLLACSQEIEKLHLLYGSGKIEMDQVLESVANNARFDLFNWVDTVLAGDVRRCVRQLKSMQGEGIEAILVLWALNREIRNLCHITYALEKRQARAQVFKTFRIWSTRQNIVSNAIKRYPQPKMWRFFLEKTVQIDRIVKGMGEGNAWDELQLLSVRVAGKRLF